MNQTTENSELQDLYKRLKKDFKDYKIRLIKSPLGDYIQIKKNLWIGIRIDNRKIMTNETQFIANYFGILILPFIKNKFDKLRTEIAKSLE